MPRVKRLIGRNVRGIVEANGEVLFTPAGSVGRWTNRLSNAVSHGVSTAAPTNKRPRWGHYGIPLKKSITASTDYDPARMRVHAAVGSKAPYSTYVDQGTGVYAGSGPYPAKIIPPWSRGDSSLYEAAWKTPSGKSSPVVMIKGQRPQGFFDKGLRAGFAKMGMVTTEVPGSGVGREAFATFPSWLSREVGNTKPGYAFRASLKEWRAWRDARWGRGGMEYRVRRQEATRARVEQRRRLAAERRPALLERRRAANRERMRKQRERERARRQQREPTARDKAQQKAARANDRAKFVAAMRKKYGWVDMDSLKYDNGYWYITVKGKDDRGRTIYREVRARARS